MTDFQKTYDWKLLEEVQEILQAFNDTTQIVCPTKSCSLSAALEGVLDVKSKLETCIGKMNGASALYLPIMDSYAKLKDYLPYFENDIYLIGIGKNLICFLLT